MGKMHLEGVTLIELMVTLALAAILVAVSVPALSNLIDNSRMNSAVNDLVSTVHFARTEAVKRRRNVVICPSSNWDTDNPSCDDTGFEQGWIVFNDEDGDQEAGAGEVLKTHAPLPDKIADNYSTDLVSPQRISFSELGVPSTGADPEVPVNFVLCDHRGDQDLGGDIAAGRVIQLSLTGRPRIYSRTDQVNCG